MQPTREQTDAIRISDKNLIVVAGAGSGKTRVLVERFLQQLEDNPDWRINALVAITFTREAAYEMRHRLRQGLEERARAGSDGLWARHLAQLDGARIDTIHGLCADIVRANAAHAGVDPRFAVLDENDSAILLEDVVQDTLASLAAPLSTLFAHYDAFRIQHTLREHALINAEVAPISDDPEALWRQWNEEWADAVFEARGSLLNCSELAALDALGAGPPTDKLSLLIEQYRGYLSDIERATDAARAAELMQRCYTEGAVRNMGSAAAWGGKDAKAQAATLLRGLRDQVKGALRLIGEPPGDIDRATAELLPLWQGLLRSVRESYRERKRENAQLDFDDLERLTAQLLQQDDVRRRYRLAEFKHLLVDEFQDTNAAQWQIISALADLRRGGSLFVVGDPKQSIYQFRGADVSVFNAVRAQIADQDEGLSLPLSTSFRSHRPLVAQFNALFSEILVRDETSPVKAFQVLFDQPMHAARAEAPALPAISLQLLDSAERDAAGELRGGKSGSGRHSTEDMRRWEAYELAQQIKRMLAEARPIFDKATRETRAMSYRDVAILFQSMTNLTLYEDAFKAEALPFLTVAGRGYFDRQEVWDMLDLLRFLHNPADDLSLATVLRSPIFAFSDDLLFALRRQRDEAADTGVPLPLWQALSAEQPADELTDEDRIAIAYARETLGELRRLAGRVAISELLRRALTMTNYLAILTGLSDGARRRGNIEKLQQLAEDSGKITLGKFTQYLSDLSAREAREGEAALEPGNAVRLMTVHASKGLEFPLVVLADASWERGGWGAPTLLADPDFGLSCSVYSAETNKYESGFTHRRNRERQAQKEAAERKRLLYVAATRAQDYLLISGSVRQSRKGDWVSGGWLKLLLAALDVQDLPREPEQACIFAGYPLSVSMPETPPPRIRRSEATATLWDFDAPPEAYPPEAPRLLEHLPSTDSRRPRHITADQLSLSGAYRHAIGTTERHESRRRLLDIAWTGTTEDETESLLEPRRDLDRQIGQIMHEVLRYDSFTGSDHASDDMISAIAWEKGLTTTADWAAALREIRALLPAYRASDACRWIADSRQMGRPVYTELTFIYRRDACVIHGVMDVLLQRADGEWVIIDHKTSRVSAGDLEAHARRYRAQMGAYAAAAQAQLGLARPPIACVHYVRHNRMIGLSAAACQRELQAHLSTFSEQRAHDGQA